ncbi:MAG: DUF4331 family protein [Gemmatimonadaceae bacterium]
MLSFTRGSARRASAIAAGAVVAAVAAAGVVRASDHQDTPTVELSPSFDINDVYAFPSPVKGRTVLAVSTSSPITPAGTAKATFGTRNKELYQIKVDNNGDAIEDLVFQLTFTGTAGNQRVTLRGPAKPNETGTANTLLRGEPTLAGPVNVQLGKANGIQLFAGPRDDPFFLDLEYFFRIVPDRKPVGGPLSLLPQTPSATSFRAAGQAQDYIKGFNDLAIVLELPTSMLVANPGSPSRFGVWATTSRPRTRS